MPRVGATLLGMLALFTALFALWSAPTSVAFVPRSCPTAGAGFDYVGAPLAVGGGRFAALRGRPLELTELAADGHVLGGTPLPVDGERHSFALACAGDGRLAAAWTELRPDGRYALKVTPAGGPAITIIEGPAADSEIPDVYDLALAFAPSGELLVAYAVPFRVYVVTVSVAGVASPAVQIGRGERTIRLAADVAANGRAIVAWETQDGGEERNKPERVNAAVRAPGARAFGHAQTIDRGGVVDEFRSIVYPESTIRLALAPDGRALLLWGQVAAHGQRPVAVSTASARGRFGRPVRVAPNGTPSDIALRADGTAIVVFTRARRLRARLRRPGHAFGRTETIGPRAAPDETRVVFLRNGHPQVSWRARQRTSLSVRRTL